MFDKLSQRKTLFNVHLDKQEARKEKCKVFIENVRKVNKREAILIY